MQKTKKTNQYGIMQGRLLPKFKGLYQAHPIDTWEQEFYLASNLNLNSIEFIFDYHLYSINPIFSKPDLILDAQNKSGIKIKSICADFYMSAPIHKATKCETNIYGDILETLISNLSYLGGSVIVLPFVDNSSMKSIEDKKNIAAFLNDFSKICATKSISLALETDFDPSTYLRFFDFIQNDFVSINYDSGNSASLGYSFDEEMKAYSNRISDIHIKDRLLNGGPVLLGDGNARLKKLKEFIINNKYEGLVIFQSFRDDEGLDIFKKQYDYFLSL